jgi:Integrase zinc binding domain
MSTPDDDLLTTDYLKRQRCVPKRPDEHVSFTPKCKVIEATEPCQSEAAELAAHKKTDLHTQTEKQPPKSSQDDPRVVDSLNHYQDLHLQIKGNQSFLRNIQKGYRKDPLFKKVLKAPKHFKNFEITNKPLYMHNLAKDHILCILVIIAHDDRCLIEVILLQAHQVLGHLGPQKTSEYIHHYYWWPHVGQDAEKYCKTCPICQITKSSTQKVPGLLHSLPIPI